MSTEAIETAKAGAFMQRRSDWGRVKVTGADRAQFLHNMTTQDIKGLAPGQGAPAAVINQRANILDHVEVHADAEAYYVVTSPGRTEDVLAWWDRYLITEDVQLTDLTAVTGLWYVSGARAREVVGAELAPFGLSEIVIAGHTVRVLGTHGLFGDGYHLWVDQAGEEAVGQALTARGATLIDDATFEALRIEWGLPLTGSELTEQRNPWEARLDESISLHKGCYLGQEIVARLNTYDKVQRYLVGLALQGEAPAVGTKLLADGQEVGHVTAVAGAIALGFVKAAQAAPGTELLAGGTPVKVADRPFWAGKTRAVSAPSRS